ncbi:hypothetical protein GCM10009745_40820 [Kribbella yunnanensis]|uniref:Type II toxin-antitoxin system Phd/YefM family antitoxin n=1 Tax=Kribbella yunnanensis TaxID=190194 RepID=A0ABN2HPL3_9ACTN
MSGLASVDEVRADLSEVLRRFRAERLWAFSFGDGGPEAVMLSYDEFEDLGGAHKFAVGDEVVSPEELAGRLGGIVEAVRRGGGVPVVWGVDGEPEAVVMSTAQYRELRGDDQPPAGVVDDPTVRVYASEPLPGSRPLDLDEWAARMGPETQEILEELRREDREGR